MCDRNRVRAVDQRWRNPFSLRNDRFRLVKVNFHTINIDTNRSQPGPRLIEKANLFADESDGDRIVERIRYMQGDVVDFGLRPIAFVNNARIGVIVNTGVERRG